MKILLAATDLTPIGNNAVRYAMNYAQALKCRLVVLHIMDLPKFKPTISESQFLQIEKKTEKTKLKKLDALIEKYLKELRIKKADLKTETAVTTGYFVTETLLRTAKKYKADMVIVGTHGLIGFKIFGSNTSEIILKSQIPVLAIPDGYQYKRIKTIVYATDLKNLINEIRGIIPLAKKLDAIIEVLYLDFGWHEPVTSNEITAITKQAKYKKIKVIVQKESKGMTVLGQIQQYLKDTNPECLVMFPEERSLFDRLFVRGKTEELVYRTQLPMLTFRKSNFEAS